MPAITAATVQAMGMLVLGLGAFVAALLLALPVLVNLPASWLGALLVLVGLVGGSVLIYSGARRLKVKA